MLSEILSSQNRYARGVPLESIASEGHRYDSLEKLSSWGKKKNVVEFGTIDQPFQSLCV